MAHLNAVCPQELHPVVLERRLGVSTSALLPTDNACSPLLPAAVPEKGSKRGEDLVRASIEENPTSVRGGAGGVTALSTQSLRPGRPDDASDDNAPVESAACGPAGGKGNGKGGPN